MEPTTDRVQCRIQGTSCHKQSWINSQPGTAMNYFICVILLILESRRRGSLGYLDFQLLLSTYLRQIDNSFVLKILFCLSLNKTYSSLFSSVFLFYFCNSAHGYVGSCLFRLAPAVTYKKSLLSIPFLFSHVYSILQLFSWGQKDVNSLQLFFLPFRLHMYKNVEQLKC